jgi:hypothetical protein
MQVTVPYKSLKHTLQSLKIQVEDSLPFIGDFIPDTIQNPEQLFYFLKDLTTYKKDPVKRELLQTVQTLLSKNNWHGVPGQGDCDCFTILALTACKYLGFEPQKVVLVGNSKFSPSHIYSLVYDQSKNRLCSMDLTNPYYDMERPYKFKQTLNFMMLELADGSRRFIPLAGKSNRKAKKAAKAERKKIKQEGKTAKKKARVARRVTKAENKTARKSSRQLRRTDRVDQKGERKFLKRSTKVAKKEKKLLRVKNKTDIMNARQQGRLQNVVSPEQSYENSYSPDMDSLIMPTESSIPGSTWQASEADSFMPEEYEEYAEYEMLPEESEEENYYDGNAEDEFYYAEPEEEYYEELSLPFLPAVAGLVSKVVKAGKSAAGKVQNSKAGNLINKGASKYNEITSLKRDNQYLKSELEREKRNKLYFAIAGTVGGVVLGTVLPKILKK